jgi:hypothetical protein
MRVALVLTAMGVLIGPPVEAETFRFTGTTTVDMTVAKDALRVVQQIGSAKLDCGVIQSVEVEVLPSTYAPSNTDNYAGSAKETYERWTVTLCGKTEPFLLGFWPASDGGVMFHVGYPFPPDANQ